VKAMFNAMKTFLVLAGVLIAGTARADDTPEGIPVKVFVVDQAGKPVQTAVVRQPQEADRHRVNTFDGSWEATTLYMPDGSEVNFTKGMVLELEISAPGYVNQHVKYEIRKKKNNMTVTLAPMVLAPEGGDEGDEGPIIGFEHDVPIDGAGTSPTPPPPPPADPSTPPSTP